MGSFYNIDSQAAFDLCFLFVEQRYIYYVRHTCIHVVKRRISKGVGDPLNKIGKVVSSA